jgi:hypothetical protein
VEQLAQRLSHTHIGNFNLLEFSANLANIPLITQVAGLRSARLGDSRPAPCKIMHPRAKIAAFA